MSKDSDEHILTTQWHTLVAHRGNDPAVIGGSDNKETSFAQLDTLAKTWQSKLVNHVSRNRAVVLRLPNGLDWLAAVLALRNLRVVVAPIDAVRSDAESIATAQAIGATHYISEAGIHPVNDVKARRWKADIALIKVTSGSSGVPKAIPFTEGELCADAENIMATMQFDQRDLNYALLPFAHSYALGNLVVPLLTKGVPLVLGGGAFPHVIAEELQRTGATVLPTVPTVLEALVRTEAIDLGKLRLIISAAATLSPSLAQRFHDKFNVLIHNFYGASETGGIAYDRDGKSGLSGDAVGQALEGVQLDISKNGHLRVTSPAVSSYRRSSATNDGAAMCLEDKVSFISGQRLVIHGRSDRVVKCAGLRLDLAEVERSLATLAAVEEVGALFDEAKDRVTICYAGSAAKAVVLATLAEAMPRFSQRFRAIKLERLPMNARGKIDQQALLQQVRANMTAL